MNELISANVSVSSDKTARVVQQRWLARRIMIWFLAAVAIGISCRISPSLNAAEPLTDGSPVKTDQSDDGLDSQRDDDTSGPIPPLESKLAPEDFNALEKASALNEKHLKQMKTVHLRFRHFSTGRFKSGITPIRCAYLLRQHDLAKNPDALREVINGLIAEGRFEPPWSEGGLYSDGTSCRTESFWKTPESASIHITDDKRSVRWDAANSQVDIELIQDNRVGQVKPTNFWRQFRDLTRDEGEKCRIHRSEGKITLTEVEEDFLGLSVIDEATGFVTKSVIRQKDRGVVQEQLWLGWEKGIAGIPFPRISIRFDYYNPDRTLSFAELLVVTEARFNVSFPETIFQLGAPAGSVILDRSAGQGEGFHGTINREVFDVTSVTQRKIAAEPLDKELSAEEKRGVEEVRRIYALPEVDILKRIGPPYPLSRAYVRRMLGDRYAQPRRAIRSDIIRFSNGKFEHHFCCSGCSFKLADLLFYLTKTEATSIEGDKSILEQAIPGDFVFRADASREELIGQLTEIAREEFQKPIRMEFREVERPIYVAEGKLNLKLPEGSQYIALNGGNHSKGDHGEIIGFGDLTGLLASTSNYIHVKVINNADPTLGKLQWSERWYDLPSTKPENRFKIDPEYVLQQITDQTGITFNEETQKFQILFVEQDAP